MLLGRVYWSLTGFDCLSTVMGEVEDPARNLPRVMATGFCLMLTLYTVPLLVGAAVDPEWRCWKEGSLAHVGHLVGGEWLGVWLLISTAFANWGLYSSELLEDSFQLQGIAEAGLAPKIFAYRMPSTGAPAAAIALQVVLVALLTALDFDAIICVDNAFSAAAMALEFAALVFLRHKKPHLHRPYRIPLSTAALAAACAIPFCYSLFMVYLSASDSRSTCGVVALAAVIGVVVGLQAEHGCMPFPSRLRGRRTR